MAFVRAKTISGKKYFYLVENKRIGERVVQKVIKYLGSQKDFANSLGDKG